MRINCLKEFISLIIASDGDESGLRVSLAKEMLESAKDTFATVDERFMYASPTIGMKLWLIETGVVDGASGGRAVGIIIFAMKLAVKQRTHLGPEDV
jgi:hypothetical protein